MNKINYRMHPKKDRICDGCKKVMKKGRPRIYLDKSWRGISYRPFYHNENCAKLDNN